MFKEGSLVKVHSQIATCVGKLKAIRADGFVELEEICQVFVMDNSGHSGKTQFKFVKIIDDCILLSGTLFIHEMREDDGWYKPYIQAMTGLIISDKMPGRTN